LQTTNISHPEVAFDISLFCTDRQPAYTLVRFLRHRQCRPGSGTQLHIFNGKEELATWTQTLEHWEGVPLEMPVEAHGSFIDWSCINYHSECRANETKEYILAISIP
ncbi:hypothetical protein C7212DRAFT_205662, partial [Tuber magnatum]